MRDTSPLVITISRQLGSGGAYIGQQLAKNLNILYADREIISQVAQQLSILEEDLESIDEKVISLWQTFLQFNKFAPDAYIAPQFVVPTNRELFKAEAEVIKRISKEHSAVIIGRCGSYILRKHPNHVSVFLYGDVSYRRARIQRLYSISEETAGKMIARNDQERAQYNRVVTGKEWADTSQYDITINTSKIGIDKSVEVIMKYLELV
jgi:CMP/dCMP kinase